jgi:hypothetical protein
MRSSKDARGRLSIGRRRLRLEPGEGLWFPGSPLVYDGSTLGKHDLDVVLTLRSELP